MRSMARHLGCLHAVKGIAQVHRVHSWETLLLLFPYRQVSAVKRIPQFIQIHAAGTKQATGNNTKPNNKLMSLTFCGKMREGAATLR